MQSSLLQRSDIVSVHIFTVHNIKDPLRKGAQKYFCKNDRKCDRKAIIDNVRCALTHLLARIRIRTRISSGTMDIRSRMSGAFLGMRQKYFLLFTT